MNIIPGVVFLLKFKVFLKKLSACWKRHTLAYFLHKMKDLFLSFTGKALLFNAQSESVEGGVSGVLTYYIPDINSTLAVTFSKPSNASVWFPNLWNVQLFSGNKEADCEKYLLGYFLFRIKAGVEYGRQLRLGSGLRFEGLMIATSFEDSLNIEVHPVE